MKRLLVVILLSVAVLSEGIASVEAGAVESDVSFSVEKAGKSTKDIKKHQKSKESKDQAVTYREKSVGELITPDTEEEVTEEIEPAEYIITNEGTLLFDESMLLYAVYNDIPIRALPTASGERIGTLNYRDEIEVWGVTVGTDDYEEGWFLLSYNGADGYVWGKNVTTAEILAEAEEEIRKELEEEQREAQEQAVTDDGDGYITCVAGQYYVIDELLALVNEDRANNGAAPLVWDGTLEQYALDRLPVIVANRKSGVDPHAGFAEGFPYTGAGGAENIHLGGATAADANTGWINSSVHHTNRTNPAYTKYAAASWQDPEDNRVYWVELFSW